MKNVLIAVLSCVMSACAFAQTAPKKEVPQEPVFPGSKWLVNDRARPAQPVVTPGETPNLPPSDADVIFNGTTLDALEMTDGKPVNWTIENGELLTGKGSARTKKKYGSAQLHIEWFTDKAIAGSDQKRGNGGVFMMGVFECQLHSSFNNPTYADGVVGSIYGQTPALVNACKAPGNWQSMDIIFNAPKFGEDGKVSEPAHVTILVNGVLTQNNTRILGPTRNKSSTTYEGFKLKEGQIVFQDHKNNPPLRYRNIWVRPIGESDPAKN